MADHVMPEGLAEYSENRERDTDFDVTTSGSTTSDAPRSDGPISEGPTGKPYRWQLPHAERPPLVALPLEAITAPVSRAAAFHREIVERTAAFLIVVSRNNAYEGRDPTLVSDDLRCGTVADLLGFGIGVLGLALADLEARGLIASTPAGGLRLTDIAALDKVSDGL